LKISPGKVGILIRYKPVRAILSTYHVEKKYTHKKIIISPERRSHNEPIIRRSSPVSLSPSLCLSLIIRGDVGDKQRNFGDQ